MKLSVDFTAEFSQNGGIKEGGSTWFNFTKFCAQSYFFFKKKLAYNGDLNINF